MRLLLSPRLRSSAGLIHEIHAGLPSLAGGPVFVSARPELTAWRGKLLSWATGQGTPVYAASFIRRRRIVLESSLLENEDLLRLILVHELFHFAWPRLGNPARLAWSDLLAVEYAARSRGELGESASLRKESAHKSERHWKDYACESFCDTAAYCYSGVSQHPWFRLASRWLHRRTDWFHQTFER